MAQAPRSMFGGFYGAAIPMAKTRNPLGQGQAPVAPTQYTPTGPRPVLQAQPQPQAQLQGQAPAAQQSAQTPNGRIPMGPPGSCPICH